VRFRALAFFMRAGSYALFFVAGAMWEAPDAGPGLFWVMLGAVATGWVASEASAEMIRRQVSDAADGPRISP
jgi:hypothetical protein